jgi:hypothetical protein
MVSLISVSRVEGVIGIGPRIPLEEFYCRSWVKFVRNLHEK